ncbi:MAG: glycerol-3-phosphate responsive antiterminator [Phycisphaerae bacterium]|jgi:glycerol uptake operon antiterminator
MTRTSRQTPVSQWLSKPVIPVFWHFEGREPLLAQASLLFLQGGELSELPPMLERLRSGPAADKPVMLHIDLLAGLTSDEAGLRYLAGLKGIDGIITVRGHLVGAARRLGLASILLLFLQDGRSVERGLHVIQQSKPDMVELVPGVAALETAAQFRAVAVPRIAGGLVRSPDLVRRLLDGGCAAVSSSDARLWELNRSA